jgi:predicted phage terminase large subunit-like protein
VLPSPAELGAERARRDLRSFVALAWPIIEPTTPLVGGMHLDLVCRHLQRVAHGHTTRLLINIPPRHGKTLLVSVLFPAWMWLSAPGTRFLTASYGLELATRDSVRTRRLVESAWYRRHWPKAARLVDDQSAKARFETLEGGARVSVSVGGPATGEGGDIIILDDPLKIDQAHSAAHRELVRDWYDHTLATRLNNPTTGSIIIVGQRLHEDDLFGHLLARGGWTHLCLPAEYDPNHPYRSPDDPRREPGELLWPDQWNQEAIDAQKRQLGGYATASMLQQLPAPTSGGIFQRAWWQWYRPNAALPGFERVIQSWDLSFTDTATADYVVGQVWGITGADRYLLRQVRARLDLTRTITAITDQTHWVTNHYPHQHGHQILIEQAANGAAVINLLHDQIPGIKPITAQGDKINRAHAVTPQIESGNVYLPGAPTSDHTTYDRAQTPTWVQDLVEETAAFPKSRHDDQVDALTQALRHATTPTYQLSISAPTGHRLPDSVAPLLIRAANQPSIGERRHHALR